MLLEEDIFLSINFCRKVHPLSTFGFSPVNTTPYNDVNRISDSQSSYHKVRPCKIYNLSLFFNSFFPGKSPKKALIFFDVQNHHRKIGQNRTFENPLLQGATFWSDINECCTPWREKSPLSGCFRITTSFFGGDFFYHFLGIFWGFFKYMFLYLYL